LSFGKKGPLHQEGRFANSVGARKRMEQKRKNTMRLMRQVSPLDMAALLSRKCLVNKSFPSGNTG
jgi:hypothetical protein